MNKQRLDERLDEYYAPIKIPDINRKGLKQTIQADLLAIIGDDEPETAVRQLEDGSQIVQVNPRNQLKAKLRQAIIEYTGGQE